MDAVHGRLKTPVPRLKSAERSNLSIMFRLPPYQRTTIESTSRSQSLSPS
jgi:hypothetical protein